MASLEDLGYSLVPARDNDGDAMRALAHDAYGRYVARIGREPGPMTADYSAIVASGNAQLVWDDGVLLGMLVTQVETDALLIENVAVSPAAQGSGLGSALLIEAERLARQHGLRDIRLYTHEAMTENLAFYARRGFVETHRATDDGFTRVFLTKRLDPTGDARASAGPRPPSK
jgi:ribosomal protein S18 acetylase RimI-like enzyme